MVIQKPTVERNGITYEMPRDKRGRFLPLNVPIIAPCPFCGADAHCEEGAKSPGWGGSVGNGCFVVVCQECLASGPVLDEQGAIDEWNRLFL